MSKKANYFSHDSNARTDEKILAVRIKYGAEGYGIYFMILENLREQTTYSCIKDYNLLAFDLRVDALKVKSIVEDFGLFSFTDDGKRFYSESFNQRMIIKDEKRTKARESALKMWENKRTHTETDANALQTHQKTDASKVKESKVKEGIQERPPDLRNSNLYRQPNIPTLQKVREAFYRNGGSEEMADKFFLKHNATGWFLSNSPIVKFESLIPSFIHNYSKFDKSQKKMVH